MIENLWQIDKTYYLGGDDRNCILYKKRKSEKTGEEVADVVGYYGTPAQALKALAIKRINCNLTSAEAVLQEIEKLNKAIEAFGKKFNKCHKNCGIEKENE